MEYSELMSEINRYFRNYSRRYYTQHAGDEPYGERWKIADGLANEINEFFVNEIQQNGYTINEQARQVRIPPNKNRRAIELMADYLLADDHLRGLTLRREANGQTRIDEEYPPIGEGASKYFERETYGPPFTPEEVRFTKACEICSSQFIDVSRRKNAKVCGNTCRGRKDALRHRKDYNEDVLGLDDESRIKRYRERQDFEYPFYSPLEMTNMSGRSEKSVEEKRIDMRAYKHDLEFDGVRFDGRRKPRYKGRDEFSPKPFIYSPRGRGSNRPSKDQLPGPVLIRNKSTVSEEQLESEKFVEASRIKGFKPYTLENCAI